MTHEHQHPPAEPSDEELRAKLEEELRKINVSDVLLQTVVTLINLAGQRLGLGEQTDEGRDLEQSRVAIDAVRALLPVLEEQEGAEQLRPVRQALAQLQMAYAQAAGTPTEGPPEGPAAGGGERAGTERERPAQGPGQAPPGRGGGGLWVPPGSKT